MPAAFEEIQAMWREGVIFKNRMMPGEIARENGRVVGVKAYGIRWKEPDKFVPSNTAKIEGTDLFIPGGTVIEAVGQRPEDSLDRILGDIERDRGYIQVDEAMATSRENVFAGGDIVNGGATVVQAVADGMKAAQAINTLLLGRKAE